MKKISSLLFTSLVLLQGQAQNGTGKPRVGMADFDCSGYTINSLQVKQYLINELIRTGKYQVMDRHETEFLAKRDSLQSEGCFSRECLSDFGKKLNVDYMFTGDIMRIGQNINVTLKLLNVSKGEFENQHVKEFLYIPGNELMMLRITLNEMFGLPNDAETVKKLTMKEDFDNAVNNPYKLRLRTDGPRMGFVFFTGTNADILMDKKSAGGFESGYPAMFQFGYQFEKQYLNEGNFQALFEFIPNISGIDQGRFIPSFTFLNGLRNNKNGWEFGIGPSITFTKMAEGFYDADNNWHLSSEKDMFPGLTPDFVTRPDSRGDVTMTTGLLIGVGKTFKSGRMNIPVNGFVIPAKNGLRFGVSFGWNAKGRYDTVK
ncbi:MAG: hypothetical protein JNL57_02445 [Bacteroidetes bacterium]|nr:hypothetical protein [Bacteroidota bacterium]